MRQLKDRGLQYYRFNYITNKQIGPIHIVVPQITFIYGTVNLVLTQFNDLKKN